MTEQPESKCNKCEECFPSTPEFFYTSNGKLKTSICKECKKIQSREYAKNYIPKKPRVYKPRKTKQIWGDRIEKRTYQDRKEYFKEYMLKKKALLTV